MDRRRFLALMASVLGAPIVGNDVVVALEKVAARRWLDDEQKGGQAFLYMTRKIPEDERDAFRENLARELADLARKVLPPGRRFEIRVQLSFDYGYFQGMCWYSDPAMMSDPSWKPVRYRSPECPYIEEGGYFLMAREVA